MGFWSAAFSPGIVLTLVSTVITIAGIVMAMSPGPSEFLFAKCCLTLSALLCAARIGASLISSQDTFLTRSFLAIVVFGFVGVGWIEGWRWIASRELVTLSKPLTAHLAAPPTLTVPPSPTPPKADTKPLEPSAAPKPTFVESDRYILSLGNNSTALQVNITTTVLQIGDSPIVQATVRDRKVLVTTRLYAGPRSQPVEVKENTFTLIDSTWDRNYNDSAFEIVNADLLPVLQIVYTTPHNVAVYGIFAAGTLNAVANSNGLRTGPRPPAKEDWPIKRIFQYPSRKYLGKELGEG